MATSWKRVLVLSTFGAMVLSSCAGPSTDPITVTGLLDKDSRTVLGEPFSYPSTTSPQVSSSIVTLEPGAETGWHLHEAPMYAYILDGTLQVTYEVNGSQVTKTYNKGEAIMEGLDTPHNGQNTSSGSVSILVVNMGSPELANTVPLRDYEPVG